MSEEDTIHAGIRATSHQLAWENTVAARYPDARFAYLPDGSRVWTSASVIPTDLLVVADKKEHTWFIPCTSVGEGTVFADKARWQFCILFLKDLRTSHPEIFNDLLKCF